MKQLKDSNIVLTYLNFDFFEICTDENDYQLRAMILCNDKPLAFFSRKLYDAQRWYTSAEKDFLCIVEGLKHGAVIMQNGRCKQKQLTKKIFQDKITMRLFLMNLNHIRSSNKYKEKKTSKTHDEADIEQSCMIGTTIYL